MQPLQPLPRRTSPVRTACVQSYGGRSTGTTAWGGEARCLRPHSRLRQVVWAGNHSLWQTAASRRRAGHSLRSIVAQLRATLLALLACQLAPSVAAAKPHLAVAPRRAQAWSHLPTLIRSCWTLQIWMLVCAGRWTLLLASKAAGCGWTSY